ncbi:biopolymer transporter Tol [Opitutaceae bacterium EW11]|nr:biopolymer transporter Tol [Opitutaceae bacterium EW11]
MKLANLASLAVLLACSVPLSVASDTPVVPDWAQPGSATHQQVPPPPDFHRATKTFPGPIGIFDGQSDIGAAVVPGSASFDPLSKRYTIHSAGYNIWYTRDEFRYLWKKASGDLSLAADIAFPNPDGYFDRKVVLVIRQDLDDDSKEVMVALHGGGLIHLAQRPEKGGNIKEDARIEAPKAGEATKHAAAPKRLAIEKRGDTFALYVSLNGEPLHPVGATAQLKLDQPFYVGIGFCSHLPATSDTAIVSNVVLENAAGKLK